VIAGVVHPGVMGAAIGGALRANGHDVIWASDGRSEATHARAVALRDVGTLAELVSEAEVILSICPPHAALDVARATAGFAGTYVDANAISPAHAREVAGLHTRFVDGGIVGAPPRRRGDTRLYLSGGTAGEVAALFDGSIVDARVVADASALKLAYAAWSKGTAAMLLSIHRVAEYYGIADALGEEWRESQPDLFERLAAAERSAAAKGWRWVGEMEEIAAAFAAAGQPDGFHRAAAEVFQTYSVVRR
jgi:3-hydroxyisobutyrate dehydrogenase-like beta-hydroxyacid dehydrogenase